MSLAERSVRRPRLLLLPFGAADRLLDIAGIDWVIARTEEQLPLPITDDQRIERDRTWTNGGRAMMAPVDMPDGVGAVVADLRANLPAAWERFIAHCALKGIPVYHSKDISESIDRQRRDRASVGEQFRLAAAELGLYAREDLR